MPQQSPRLRRDAQRNRALLIGAALEVFAEQGIEVRLDEIADRAGVGHGTLYRHFPTRQALVEAIFAERVDEFLAVCEAALEGAEGWEGFVSFLEGVLTLQTQDRFLREIFVRYPPGEGRLTGATKQIGAIFERVLDRAHRARVLRSDFELADLMMLLWSFASVIDATADSASEAWRRHLHWLLDGLRPAAATVQSQPPLTKAELTDAMRSIRRHRLAPATKPGVFRPT
jgi:AcrR family transcriptional regulator